MTLPRALGRIAGLGFLVGLALVGSSLGGPAGPSQPPADAPPMPLPQGPSPLPGATAGSNAPAGEAPLGINATGLPGLVNGTGPGPQPIPVGCDDARAGGLVELGDTAVTFGSVVRDPSLARYACDVEGNSTRMQRALGNPSGPHHPRTDEGIPNPPGVGEPGPTPEPTGGHAWEWRPVGHHHDAYTLTGHPHGDGSR